MGTANSSTRLDVLTSAGKRNGKTKIESVEATLLKEQYLDVELEGEWSCGKEARDCEHHRYVATS